MLSRPELKKLMEKYTIEEIAKKQNKHRRTISLWIEKYGLSYEKIRLSQYQPELTAFQLDFLTGSLLGDGSIKKEGSYSLSQKASKEEYVEYVGEILDGFGPRIRDEQWKSPIKLPGKKLSRSRFTTPGKALTTIVHPVFKTIREKWYPGDKKNVPEDLHLTSFSLAIWYMEDGSNHTGKSKEIRLHTQGFSERDHQILVSSLQKLGLAAHRKLDHQDNPYLRIPAESYFNFIQKVEQFVLPCFGYKIDTSNAPTDFVKKVTPEIRSKLLELNKEGYTQNWLSQRFGISQSHVSRLLVQSGAENISELV